MAQERPQKNIKRRWPSATQGESPHQTLTQEYPELGLPASRTVRK
jgi:hypothetical protein